VKYCLWLAAAFTALGASTTLFSQQGWTVKQEWVRAHEDFLASDVLAGRGSATRDEELTATYVASEFESYGLKTAPGMSGYLQTAEVIAPKLDGQATVQTGDASLKEGADFFLLTSTGAAVTGKLVRVASADAKSTTLAPGSGVLLTGATDTKALFPALTALRRQGATVILVPETPGLSTLPQMFGGAQGHDGYPCAPGRGGEAVGERWSDSHSYGSRGAAAETADLQCHWLPCRH
jgi:aminopeptidase YwaD